MREWLLQGLVNLLDQTGAKLLIFDQPDRLNLSNAQWIDFLNVVEKIRRERGLSILLVVSTRTRNTGRAVELFHAYKHQLTTTFADSVVAVCRSHSYPQQRYIKHLKCKNRMPAITGNVDVFTINQTEENYLDIVCEEVQREEKLLPRSKAQERLDKIMTAEGHRREGVSIRQIAELFDVPESTMRGWVGSIAVEDPRDTYQMKKPMFSWARPNDGPQRIAIKTGYVSPLIDDTAKEDAEDIIIPQVGKAKTTTCALPDSISVFNEVGNEEENTERKRAAELPPEEFQLDGVTYRFMEVSTRQ